MAPFVAAGDSSEPLRVDTAILLTLRNEDPGRALQRLRVVKQSIDATGFGERFSYFVLSDTNDPVLAIEEEAMAHAWALETGAPHRVIYRRRSDNEGFKAGNVRDFCSRWGSSFELMLPLDADSLMTGDTILRMVRMMQAHPRLGILQSLVTGMPTRSGFARIIPVRDAPWNAALHPRLRLVDGRLRSILGSQRVGADQAIRRPLRHCRSSPEPAPCPGMYFRTIRSRRP